MYCLLVRYSFIFDSFRASQAIYKNLWYVSYPLLKETCLLFGQFDNNAQAAKKKHI